MKVTHTGLGFHPSQRPHGVKLHEGWAPRTEYLLRVHKLSTLLSAHFGEAVHVRPSSRADYARFSKTAKKGIIVGEQGFGRRSICVTLLVALPLLASRVRPIPRLRRAPLQGEEKF